MDCNIIKDLIPLCIDDCCSEESAKIVKEHIENCPDCKAIYDSMNDNSDIIPKVEPPKKLNRINDWKASVLQSVLLFVSFALITIGVSLEASTPVGLMNGCWAMWLVIPTTGFLLSLANWYFVRLYKSRKVFSRCSLLATFLMTVIAYLWAFNHYEFDYMAFFRGGGIIAFLDMVRAITLLDGIGFVLTAVFCVLSKVLSNKYAKMLGKE